MTNSSTVAGNLRRHAPTLAQIVRRWITTMAERQRRRREIAQLSRLPLYLLRDMGLEEFAAHRAPSPMTHWH
jgi:uncharacterized protein YjiS (DUF1127 family)